MILWNLITIFTSNKAKQDQLNQSITEISKKVFTNPQKHVIIYSYRKVIEKERGSVLECDSFVKIASKKAEIQPRGSTNAVKSAV